MNSILKCPWDAYPRDPFPTCEKSVCSWIQEPANTWSNLVFLGVALYLLGRHFKLWSKGAPSIHPLDFAIALCTLFIGACSFGAHATLTEFFGFLDFASIFSIFSLLTALNWKRLHWPGSASSLWGLAIAVFTTSIVALKIFGYFRVGIFSVFIAFILVSEARICCLKNSSDLKNERTLAQKKILGCFTAGAICLGMDNSVRLCSPENHVFQFHSLWHLFMALSILSVANYLRDFVPLK